MATVESVFAVLLEFPFFVVEGADRSGFQPARNAMEVERVVARAPRHRALFIVADARVRLAIDARLVDMRPANSTGVHVDL